MVLFSCKDKFLVCLVHGNLGAAGYTAGTHAAGNNSCMACHTAADSQDTLGSLHALDILRRSLQTNQDYLLASCRPCLCILCRKYDLTAGSSRRCSQSLGHRLCLLQCVLVKLRVKQCIQVSRIDHGNSLLLIDHTLIYQITGDLKSSLGSSLTITGLQHIKLSVLNGKLHILHISVVILQFIADTYKLIINFRHNLF